MSKVRKVGLSAVVAALAALFITGWEGTKLVASHNRFDPAGIVDVCNGQTNQDWPWLKPGMRFTPAECRKALEAGIPKYAAPLQACIHDFDKMPPHRQVAFISMSWNLGPRTVCRSTAVRELNRGHIRAACNAILRYNRAAGKVLRGLVRRRRAERKLCLRED